MDNQYDSKVIKKDTKSSPLRKRKKSQRFSKVKNFNADKKSTDSSKNVMSENGR